MANNLMPVNVKKASVEVSHLLVIASKVYPRWIDFS